MESIFQFDRISGFESFKQRIAQEIQCQYEISLEDWASDSELYDLYRRGLPENWTLDCISSRAAG